MSCDLAALINQDDFSNGFGCFSNVGYIIFDFHIGVLYILGIINCLVADCD